MRKFYLFLLLCCFLAAIAAPAFASSGFKIYINGNPLYLQDESPFAYEGRTPPLYIGLGL